MKIPSWDKYYKQERPKHDGNYIEYWEANGAAPYSYYRSNNNNFPNIYDTFIKVNILVDVYIKQEYKKLLKETKVGKILYDR